MPTYNRSRTLQRVSESLKAQTYRDLEWLIVNDGQTDGTHAFAACLQREAILPIRHIRKERRGVCVARRHRLPASLVQTDTCEPQVLAEPMMNLMVATQVENTTARPCRPEDNA